MKFVPNAVTKRVARQALLVNKNSPGLLFAGGIAGVTVSTVLACRATLKLSDVLDETKQDLEIANAIDDPEYVAKERTKDVTRIYIRAAASTVVLYAPSVIVGAASIGALTASHNILSRRNVALTAAYAALDKGFNDYRERVIEKYGPDQDLAFRYEMEEVETIDEKGKKVKELQAAPGADSIYARFFDQLCSPWSKEPEYNLLFLKNQQNYANDLLNSRGHVFLNEVYDMLGMPRSKAGAVVGWVRGEGDSFIDFSMFDDENRDFINGREGAVLLDFNVDGVIFDKIDRNQERLSWQK